MSMVESGLGISILPQLILKRVPYNIITKELDIPAYCNIGLALKDKKVHHWQLNDFWNICSIDNSLNSDLNILRHCGYICHFLSSFIKGITNCLHNKIAPEFNNQYLFDYLKFNTK